MRKWSDKPKTENSWKNSLKKKLEQHQKKKIVKNKQMTDENIKK